MSEALAKTWDPERLVLEYLSDQRSDLKDLIIIQYSSTVERIARKFAGSETADDLTQVGYIGLLNALSKYDPEAGVRFNTYATHLIAGEIKHYLRDKSQTIRQPAWLQELRHKVNRTMTILQGELGRPATEREIAERMGVSESQVQEVMQTQGTLRVSSLNTSPGDDEDSESEVDRLDSNLVTHESISVEDRVVLETAMQQLRDLEREVLVLFHFDSLNQTEIASRLGISCNYVSHILRQSLSKLRRILSNEEEQDRNLRVKGNANDRSIMDAETGIYNEDYFRQRLTEEIHRTSASEGVVSVVVLEFSGLNALKSFYGETSVRDFMIDAAAFLKSSVRALDIVCRNGTSGFGLILPGTGESCANAVARLEKRISQWLMTRVASNSPLRVSFGYATAPDHGRSVADLLKLAQQDASQSTENRPAA